MMQHKNLSVIVIFAVHILEVIIGMKLSMSASRACVVGGGFSGLATARHMKDYGVNFKLFEARKEIGGIWKFDPHIGMDEDGLPRFTTIYKNLRTNVPRQTMEFSGFPFPDDTPSYLSGSCYYKYIKKFVKNFSLNKHVQLQSLITSVKWAEDRWNISYIKTDTKERHTESCDFVVIANGQFNTAKWPVIKGLKIFEGNMIHSQDYKEPGPFVNRRVLIVGAGASGLDLATHLCNVTKKLVHSHHLVYNEPKFSDSYVKKPDIKAFTKTGAIFKDGTFEEVDDVIFCTGYNYNHTFLAENVGLLVTSKFVLPLYQDLVNVKHPSMVFVGISKGVINRLLDAQAEYAAALASGKFNLPSQEQMLKSSFDHLHYIQSRGIRINYVNLITNTDQYFGNLTKEAGIVRVPVVVSKIKNFVAIKPFEDLLNYRDYEYKVIDDYNYERRYNPRDKATCSIET